MDARPEEHHPRGEAVHEDAQQQRRGIAARHIADDAYHPWSEGKGELIEGDDATDHCSETFLWEFVVDDERRQRGHIPDRETNAHTREIDGETCWKGEHGPQGERLEEEIDARHQAPIDALDADPRDQAP